MNRRVDEEYIRTPDCYCFDDCVDTSRVFVTPKFSLGSTILAFRLSTFLVNELSFKRDHQEIEAIGSFNLWPAIRGRFDLGLLQA